MRLVVLWLVLRFAVAYGAAEDEPPVPVHEVLRAAVEAFDFGKKDATKEEAAKIVESCVSSEASEAWRKIVQMAADEIIQATKRSVQRGLTHLSSGFIDLIKGTTCGNLTAVNRMVEEAERLKVLASYRSLASLDSKVKYEPLKSLLLGDIDVHTELNAFVEAWQLKKSSEELGTSLGQLLEKFADDPDEEKAKLADGVAFSHKHQKHTAAYWVQAFNAAYKFLGDSSAPMTSGCVSEDAAGRLGKILDQSFETMMQQSRRAMQTGLKQVSKEIEAVLGELEVPCDKIKNSAAAKHLREATKRLAVLSAVKNLVNPGVHVEYDPKKVLKVGGVDIHLELNRFIGAWIGDESPENLGKGLADFFEDFKEQEEVDDKKEAAPTEDSANLQMIKGALNEAMSKGLARRAETVKFGPTCFKESTLAPFGDSVGAAIEHMLQKRKKRMQQGLKELASATDTLFSAQPADCVSSSGARAIWKGAKKLKSITRRLVVDYGSHIKYEAMKSLVIGGADVHKEINEFLSAWKLRTRPEAGPGFGQLMRRLSSVSGYNDEL